MTCPRFYTLEEVAEASRATVATVRHWVRVGKLPAHKPGRRILVSEQDLVAFLTGSPVTSVPSALAEDDGGDAA